jgi:D-alanyl-D-alanine carboxypeptidase/D-alanyl-D-alanine-endopeptidase (penicillin-binding protein 4)
MVALADGIVAKGIRTIGVLQVDDSRYDQVRYLPTWKPTYKTEGQVGSLGALIVNNGFASWDGTRVPADDPAIDAGNQLTALLKDRGVTVASVAHGTPVGNTTEVAAVTSPPLRDIVGEMLRVSDNTTAEMLVREIAVKTGRPGSTPPGVEAVTAALTERGVPMNGVKLLDGSGLSRDNQLTCGALIKAIELGREPGPGELASLLSVAGESGTLAARFQGTPLQGKLRAKTGNLLGVTALGGLVETYRPIPFSFVADGSFSEAEGAQLQGQVAAAIARFPAAPGATQLVPAVASPCTQPACR